MTNPTVPVTGESGQGLIITPVKKLMIQALRATFTAMYPNTRLASMNIDMEYPYLEEQYPGIWVRFSPHTLRSSGVDPTTHAATEIYGQWYFEGTISLTIAALTSKERDLISDGFIEAYAFANMMPSVSPFYQTINSSDLVNMTLQSDILTPGGQTETQAVPWDPNKLAYEDRYSFEVIGNVRSRLQSGVVFTNLSQIQTTSTLTNVTGAPNNTMGSDGNGVWQ